MSKQLMQNQDFTVQSSRSYRILLISKSRSPVRCLSTTNTLDLTQGVLCLKNSLHLEQFHQRTSFPSQKRPSAHKTKKEKIEEGFSKCASAFICTFEGTSKAKFKIKIIQVLQKCRNFSLSMAIKELQLRVEQSRTIIETF